MMPLNWVLLRHGHSEGNAANERSKKGDDALFTPDFLDRPSWMWRLTNFGRWQANGAGNWLRQNFQNRFFDFLFCSEYVRALETAGVLGIPGIWRREINLRERDWGVADVMTMEERRRRFAEEIARRERAPLLHAYPGGESLANLFRVSRHFDTLQRECESSNVLTVCHGEVMWYIRLRLERMTMRQFEELERSKHPYDRIHNCQILHYTRVDPVTGIKATSYQWMRSICPWDQSLSSNEWRPIIRPRHTGDQLLAEALQIPQLVNVDVPSKYRAS